VLSQYPTPTQPSVPQSIVAGPDGNIWFTETGVPQLGKVFIAKRTHAKRSFDS
jgi:streptogramin lyase